MRIIAAVAIVVSIMFGATANAQQTLNVDVLERYGNLTLEGDGIGCFDVLAASRLQTEFQSGAFTEATAQAFSFGTCVLAVQGAELVGAQKVEIAAATLIRGDVSGAGVTIYFPEELLNGAPDDTGIASLKANAAALKNRVDAMEQCAQERDALDEKILDFNARVEAAVAALSEDEPKTGSRLKNNTSVTVTSVELADTAAEALHQESVALQAEADAHKERCGAYEAGTALDQDYMPFYRAMHTARS